MSTIKLNSMTCVKLQDSISEDEIEVRVGGSKVAGPIGIHKGQTVSLGGIPRSFTGAVAVQLLELDSNSDPDSLGLRSVGDDPVTGGNLIFDQASKANYTVNYTVV
jgi:hypothetical protein